MENQLTALPPEILQLEKLEILLLLRNPLTVLLEIKEIMSRLKN